MIKVTLGIISKSFFSSLLIPLFFIGRSFSIMFSFVNIGKYNQVRMELLQEMGFGPKSTQKLIQELRFLLTLINGPSP